jgi:hypothetical protein
MMVVVKLMTNAITISYYHIDSALKTPTDANTLLKVVYFCSNLDNVTPLSNHLNTLDEINILFRKQAIQT